MFDGSNVALIAALMLGVSRRLVGQWATLVALVGIGAYDVLVGAKALLLRAALMGGLVVAAGVGRRSTALISLAVACRIMLLVNPRTLYHVGFQLSEAATLGLILFASDMMQWLSARRPWLQGGLLTSDAGDDGRDDVSMGALVRGMVVDAGVVTVAATRNVSINLGQRSQEFREAPMGRSGHPSHRQ